MLNYQRVYTCIYNTGWWFQPLKKISQLGLYPSDQIAISPWSLLQGDGQHHQGTNSEGAPPGASRPQPPEPTGFQRMGTELESTSWVFLGIMGKIPKKIWRYFMDNFMVFGSIFHGHSIYKWGWSLREKNRWLENVATWIMTCFLTWAINKWDFTGFNRNIPW